MPGTVATPVALGDMVVNVAVPETLAALSVPARSLYQLVLVPDNLSVVGSLSVCD